MLKIAVELGAVPVSAQVSFDASFTVNAQFFPATSALVVGQSIDETPNWSTFLASTNYTSSDQADSGIQPVVTVNFTGASVSDAATALADGDTNVFSITVTWTASGNTRTFATASRTALHVPPVAGSLAAVNEVQGSGTPTVNLAAGFTGSDLVYTSNQAWATVSGSTLTIADVVRADTVTITATNSGGSAQVDLSVTISDFVETAFVMTFETTAVNEPFTMPLRNTGTTSAVMTIDGGADISITGYDDANLTQIIPTPGIHTLRLSGQVGAPFFNGSSAAPKVRTVENFGSWNGTDMREAFRGCSGLTSFTFGNCDVSNVALFTGMINDCDALTIIDFRGISTPAATNLRTMCVSCASLVTVLGISYIDTGNVTRMDEMFWNCPNLDTSNFDISGWNLESLTPRDGLNFRGMFNFFPNDKVLPQAIYDAFLTNLNTQTLAPGIFIGLKSTPYTEGGAVETTRNTLIGTKGINLEDAGNATPDQMAAPSLVVNSGTQITATLAADPFTNGLPILSYELRYSTDETNWTVQNNVSSPVVLSGLEAGTTLYVQTRAANYNSQIGTPSDWSPSAVATTTAVVTISVENAGNEPSIEAPLSDDPFIMTYGGVSYSTNVVTDAPLTTNMINAAPTPISNEPLTGTPNVGEVIGGPVPYFLYDGPDPGDSTFTWTFNDVIVSGATAENYTATAEGVLRRITTFGGVSVTSPPLTIVAVASGITDPVTDMTAIVDHWDASNEATITAPSDLLGTIATRVTGGVGLFGNASPQTGIAARDVNGLNVIYIDSTGKNKYLGNAGGDYTSIGTSGTFAFYVGVKIPPSPRANGNGGDTIFAIKAGTATVRFSAREAGAFPGRVEHTLGGQGSLVVQNFSTTGWEGQVCLLQAHFDFVTGRMDAWMNGTQVITNIPYTNIISGAAANASLRIMSNDANNRALEGDFLEAVALTDLTQRDDFKTYFDAKWRA